MFERGMFSVLSTVFMFIYFGFFIYMIYLFHTLAMSNKKIAETLEVISSKLDNNLKKD